MQTRSSGSGPPPLPPDAAVAAGALGATPFGVFRRHRSPAGADVFPRGFPTRGARPIERVPLADALSRRWDDDRHFVLYTSDKPYRINNAALSKARVEVQLLALDVDNHDDVPGWMEGERAKVAALLLAHPGGFVHTTRRGWRALYALPIPIPIRSEDDKDAFARHYACVAAYLFERFGIVADDALTRWNQPVRLPHVVREGRPFDAEILSGDALAVGAFALPPDVSNIPDLRALAAALPRWGGVAKRWEPRRSVLRVATSAAFDQVPLPPLAERIAAAERWAREEAPRAVLRQGGRATARSVAATLHVGFALERADVARILTGPYNRRRCSPPWGPDEMDDLVGIAQAVARTPIQPWGFMLSRDRTGIEAARAVLTATAEGRNVAALEDVGARIVAAVEQHQAVVIRATYGAGKTYAISRYVAEHRAGRVLVVVPRHELARAWVGELAAAGETDVAYHASVVQRRDEAGRRHCDNKVALKVYRHGGDVARDVCPSCPRAATCPAYAARPEPSARVHVLPREMLPKMNVTGEELVVCDDAAVDLLAWHRLTVRQLQRLGGVDERALPRDQAHMLRTFVRALLAGPRGAEEAARAGLAEASLVAPGEGSGGALRLVASRLAEGQRSPRVPRDALVQGGDELAETLRDLGRMREVLRFAAAYAAGAEVNWSEGARTVHGESELASLVREHSGRLVLLDAAANVEELRALRPDLHVERLDVGDAGDASRLLLFAKNATRTALLDGRRRRSLVDLWLGAALEHLTARRAKRPVFVVYKSLEEELRAHPALRAWCAASPKRDVRFAHYGAVRGSNRFQGRDAVVTLCDPWLHGDDVLGRADRLGLDEPSYRVALATAELGQAHGRSRSVRRKRRLTHIHVGRLVPDGWGAGVDVRPLGGPPERLHGAGDRVEFRALVVALGGNRGAAPLLGCSPSAIAGWTSGVRGLPRAMLERARTLATDRVHQPVSSGEAGAARAGAGMDAPACKSDHSECVHPFAGPVRSEGVRESGQPHSEEAESFGGASLSPTERVVPAVVAGPASSEIDPSLGAVVAACAGDHGASPKRFGESPLPVGPAAGGGRERAASPAIPFARRLPNLTGTREVPFPVREVDGMQGPASVWCAPPGNAPGGALGALDAGGRVPVVCHARVAREAVCARAVGTSRDDYRRRLRLAARSQSRPPDTPGSGAVLAARNRTPLTRGAGANAAFGEQALAMLERVAATPSRAPRAPPRGGPTFEDELAALREAQALARRQRGLG